MRLGRLLLILFLAAAAQAETYYISSAGNDNNDGLSLITPIKTFAHAASLAQPGDTFNVRGGVYTDYIAPTSSGTSGNQITYQNYAGETVTISGTLYGADLKGIHYHTIDGFNFINQTDSWIDMRNLTGDKDNPGSSYNRILNNTFFQCNHYGGIWLERSSYCEIRNNTVTEYCPCDEVCNTSGPDDLIYIRQHCWYNVVANNTVDGGSHDAINIMGKNGQSGYNVIRDNWVRNKNHEGVTQWYDSDWGLVSGNTIIDCGEEHATAWCASEKDRSLDRRFHGGIKVSSDNCIIRRNVVVNAGEGMKLQSHDTADSGRRSTHARVYHNTFVANFYGHYVNSRKPSNNHIFKNNVFHDNSLYGIFAWNRTGDASTNNNTYQYNNFSTDTLLSFDEKEQTLAYFEANVSHEWANNMAVDPKFRNETGYNFDDNYTIDINDLSPRSDSAMIDAGDWLTTITSATGSGNTVTVADANYFYDGWGIPNETGDVVQLQGKTGTVTIVDVNYTTNVIEFDQTVNWTVGDGIALPYIGSGPDIGALEYILPSPDRAETPNPADGATGVSVDGILQFIDGYGATQHKIYFGTDPTPDEGEYQAILNDRKFDPGVLDYSTTYYWRVDEVNIINESTGETWVFQTEASGSGPSDWYDPSYPKRRKFTFQTPNVGSNLTDFPAYIRINSDSDIGKDCQEDGADLVFTTDDGQTLVAHQIENFSVASNAATGDIWAIYDVNASTASWGYVYWGNPLAVSTEDPDGVWDSDYLMVSHLDSLDPNDVFTDSTSNNAHGDYSGGFPSAGTGIVYIGQSGNGNADFIDMNDNDDFDIGTGTLTLSAWVQKDDLSELSFIFDKRQTNSGSAGTPGYMMYINSSNKFKMLTDDGTTVKQTDSTFTLADTNFHHYVCVIAGTANTVTYYVDGTSYGTVAISTGDISNDKPFYISGFSSSAIDGVIDEVRVSDVGRSADWIDFQYHNIAESDNELTWGAVEEFSPNNIIQPRSTIIFIVEQP